MEHFGFANFKPKTRYRKYRQGGPRAGIYCLRDGDQIYVGESTDIERRIQDHICEMIQEKHRMQKIDEWYVLLRMPKSTWRERLVQEKHFCLLLSKTCNVVSKPHVCA